MRQLHLAVGLLAVFAFLVTGLSMRYHTPPLVTMSDSARLMFRSRHIYILAGALVNLALGVYLQRLPAGWRKTAQTVGSAFLTIAPALLVMAFILEPNGSLHDETLFSHAGIFALFLGSVTHLACGPVKVG